MQSPVRDAETLEVAVGDRPIGSMLKTIHHLDEHCRTIIDHSVAAAVVHAPSSGPLSTRLVGGEVGFVTIDDDTHLTLGADLPEGSTGLLFFTAGWRETLRVNGHIGTGGGLEVDEAFVHCGKAMIRSEFWAGHGEVTSGNGAESAGMLTEAHREFLTTARMAVLGSCDAAGGADVSPKGDHAGFIQVLDDSTIAIPNRPGNRRTDTFHNLVERDDVVVMALTPGDDRAMTLQGRARLQTDAGLLASMAVNDKAPTIALVVDVDHVSLERDDVLAKSRLWDTSTHIPSDELPKATQVWTDHVKMDETPGDEAQMIRDYINAEDMATGIAQDYVQNLY